MVKQKTLRTCEKGHRYYKRSDCPTCPKCEKEKKPKDGFLSLLSSLQEVHWSIFRLILENFPTIPRRNLKVTRHGKASLPILRKASEKGLL